MALRHLFLFFFFVTVLILPLTSNASRYRIPVLPPPSRMLNGLDGAKIAKAKANYDHLLSEIGKLTFNVLPRGMPIPPSGPSKKHNGVTASVATQQDATP